MRPMWFWETEVQLHHQGHDVVNSGGAGGCCRWSKSPWTEPNRHFWGRLGQITPRPSCKPNPAPSHNRVVGHHYLQTASRAVPSPGSLKVMGDIFQLWTTQTCWYWALSQDDKSPLDYCLCPERNSKLKDTQRRSRIYHFLSSSRWSYTLLKIKSNYSNLWDWEINLIAVHALRFINLSAKYGTEKTVNSEMLKKKTKTPNQNTKTKSNPTNLLHEQLFWPNCFRTDSATALHLLFPSQILLRAGTSKREPDHYLLSRVFKRRTPK